jgi:hypothetical protein
LSIDANGSILSSNGMSSVVINSQGRSDQPLWSRFAVTSV